MGGFRNKSGMTARRKPRASLAPANPLDIPASTANLRAGSASSDIQVTDIFSHGTVHQAADDLQAAVRADPAIHALWEGLTPLGRNEFICWVEDAKQPATRQRRITRTVEELAEGKKRPC